MKSKLLFSAIAFILLLASLELASRFLEITLSKTTASSTIKPGWQAEFFKSFLDWHEPDPDLLWRFKANLDNPLIKTNPAHLLGLEFSANKPASTFRILLLGDSSPVGLGLKSRKQAFGEILQNLLQTYYAGQKNIELINAAVSGYTSEQIARFLRLRGWEYDPDLVILYCGNNDASISGAFTDRQLLQGQYLKDIRRLLFHSALYRVMKGLIAPERDNTRQSPSSLQVRVPAEQYGENLADIADQCQRHDCPFIILRPPVPFLWPAGLQFKTFIHTTGSDGRLILPDEMASLLGRQLKYCLDINRFQEIYGQGDIFARNVYLSAYNDSLSPNDAIVHYQELLENAPEDPVLLNNLGVSYWQNRIYADADHFLKQARDKFIQRHTADICPAIIAAGSPFSFNIGINLLSESQLPLDSLDKSQSPGFQYLDSALQADYFSLRIKQDYLRKIDSFMDKKGVTVIDLPTIFAENGGERLFIDHCHPTAQGHLLIAEALFREIIRY
jgi:lysophospholipase L1-like esterase